MHGEKAHPQGCHFGSTATGWSNGYTWNALLEYFGKWLVSYRVRLKVGSDTKAYLFVDGHETHFNRAAKRICEKYGIVILKLPPHLSHLL